MSLERLASVLASTTGLDVAALGRSGLVAALQGHCDAADAPAVASLAERVAVDGELRRRLVADLLVHETSFFRYPGSFSYMVAEVHRRLAAGARVVRVLSAPCSTGQEPVSLVMALHEVGLDASALHVDAVDVSASILERARRGVYGPGETRSLSDERRRRFLRDVPGGAALLPQLLEPIRYQQADLLDPLFGLGLAPYDLVLCRNLLIYLTGEARERLIGTLRRLLAPGGVLFVGHAEVVPLRALGLVARGSGDAYALADEPAPTPAPAPAARATPPRPARAPSAPRRERRASAPPRVAREAPPQAEAPRNDPSPEPSTLVLARRLGQDGRAEEALALLARVAAERTPSPDELHLTAVLARALGRPEEADRALTRALYLEPRHAPALRLAALVADERGEREAARRFEARAQRAEADAAARAAKVEADRA